MEAEGLIRPETTHHRADQRQHRHRAGLRRRRQGAKLILVMPESMSIERRKMLILLGARLELTAAEKGMTGAVARARELLDEIPGSVMPQQFENPANPLIHRVSTAEEIWNDTGGAVDVVVSRRRHRRHHHRRRPGAEGEQAVGADDRGRADRLGGAFRRPARAAQDPGHRRRLRAGDPRPRGDRRDHRR